MIAVFYDRRNRVEVRNDELMKIKLTETTISVDADEACGEWKPEKHQAYLACKVVGELGYKGPNCGEFQNWDLWTNESELVFLRMEEKK